MRWPSYRQHVSLESRFDDTLIAGLASAEKQVQQAYRPIIQVHKWFARRPGTLFRGLLLSHFADEPLAEGFWRGHELKGVVLDPFQGGGTTLFEANRLGLSVVGYDTNPLSRWLNERALEPLDVAAYLEQGEKIAEAVEAEIGHLSRTRCTECGGQAEVKYFLWVKTHACPDCGTETLMLPGSLLAGPRMQRHTHEVHLCGHCRHIAQFLPGRRPDDCPACGESYERSRVGRVGSCQGCSAQFVATPTMKSPRSEPPGHALVALEYHCPTCKRRDGRRGRFFKGADAEDHSRFAEAHRFYGELGQSPFWPTDEIAAGDETNRLLRWGYRSWQQLSNERQLVGLHLLASRINEAPGGLRPALATTFSDLIRYHNLCCRYDPAALKVLDVFSIHGFPVGRVQCEAALIGIPGIGSGAWRHWLVKYATAKEWGKAPFETRRTNGRKQLVRTEPERVAASFVTDPDALEKTRRTALLRTASLSDEPLPENSVDLVATDPPYHDSVAYSELLDYCWAWLRRLAEQDEPWVADYPHTRSDAEATGSRTAGRQLEHYAEALSRVYRGATLALKPGQPFVFTFHDNELSSYASIAVALLDTGLVPTRTISCPSEMRGSIHINATGSSRVDTVFCLRKPPAVLPDARPLPALISEQVAHLEAAGVHVSTGDRRCLTYGVLCERAVRNLHTDWMSDAPIGKRLERTLLELQHLEAALEEGAAKTRTATRRP